MLYLRLPDGEIYRLRKPENEVKEMLYSKYDPETIIVVENGKGKEIDRLKLSDIFENYKK